MSFLVKQMDYEERDIVLVGRSMGSGPSCHLAGKFPATSGLVLISPFTSLKAAT